MKPLRRTAKNLLPYLPALLLVLITIVAFA